MENCDNGDIKIAKQVADRLIGELVFFVKELTHFDRLIMTAGWGNGYVCIPKWHQCFEMSYDYIHEKYGIRVHCGLTLSEYASALKWPEIPADQQDSWVVGFDTAHSGDTLQKWPKEAVLAEAKDLAMQLASIR